MKKQRKITQADLDLIGAIVMRALVLFPDRKERDMMMDLMVTHLKTPLRLEELLEADNINFTHDIVGIERHLDRQTLELRNCFVPRYAKSQRSNPSETNP